MAKDVARLKELDARLAVKPSVTHWSRLEPLAMTRGDLSPGLQALLGDPLWLLGRQWQFEELRGEDAGSPVKVDIQGEHGPLTRFHPGPYGADPAAESVDLAAAVPIEALVGAEPVDQLPDRVRAEAGLQLLRMLSAEELPSALRQALVDDHSFRPAVAHGADPVGDGRRRVLTARVPDADLVVADLAPLRAADGSLTGLPANLAAAAGGRDADTRAVLERWLRLLEGYFARPGGESWNPYRQEHTFAAQAELGSGRVVLRCEEHTGGSVDWFSFEASNAPALGTPAAPAPAASFEQTVLPTPVRYPGMPAERLWAFEDAQVYVGGLDAGPTDLARLALVEYALAYGNDWYLVPVDLPYGSVARVSGLTVHDTFGRKIAVRPARQASQPGWTLFHLPGQLEGGPLADVFVLPATVRGALESAPLEEVAFFRDEMANLVWAVEHITAGPSGEPVSRDAQAAQDMPRASTPTDLDGAEIVYRLTTPVPANWIPFVAVPAAGTPAGSGLIELERRPLSQARDDGTRHDVHPVGQILLTSPGSAPATDRLRIAEEEVPREGAVVTRSYRLARTEGGGTVLWRGRRKRIGRGEGSSGLRYDTALPPDTA